MEAFFFIMSVIFFAMVVGVYTADLVDADNEKF